MPHLICRRTKPLGSLQPSCRTLMTFDALSQQCTTCCMAALTTSVFLLSGGLQRRQEGRGREGRHAQAVVRQFALGACHIPHKPIASEHACGSLPLLLRFLQCSAGVGHVRTAAGSPVEVLHTSSMQHSRVDLMMMALCISRVWLGRAWRLTQPIEADAFRCGC